MRCVYLDSEGRLVLYFYNQEKWRQHATDSLIVKKVQEHSQVQNDIRGSSRRRSLRSNLSRSRLNSSFSRQSSSEFQHCAICLEAYTVGEDVSWSKILLDCKHAYHPACIKEWLMRNAGCPCCRSSFIHPNDLKVHFFFGAKSAKARWIEQKNQIIARRAQGEFCVEHGLIFPSESMLHFDEEESNMPTNNSNSDHDHVSIEREEECKTCQEEPVPQSQSACDSFDSFPIIQPMLGPNETKSGNI